MRIAEKAARILLTVIGFFGLAVFFLPKIGISVDIVMSGSMEPTLKTGGIVFTDTKRSHSIAEPEPQDWILHGSDKNCSKRTRIRKALLLLRVFFLVLPGKIHFLEASETV